MPPFDRRQLLSAGAAGAASLGLAPLAHAAPGSSPVPSRPDGPVVIGSGNGVAACERARARIVAGVDPVDAVVEGVGLVEADPDDLSVGYGGLPNADGVVQLDASVMHGPSHKAGAVAALEGILHPSQVALAVLKRTDHAMLVGEGARQFATDLGFPTQDLLTPRARQAWLRWRAGANSRDAWLDADQQLHTEGEREVPYTTGTLHLSGTDAAGNVSAVTTTSGMSYKIPGRVSDSGLIGGGMYVDNAVGSAGATGRGEAVLQSCGSYEVVRGMERGLEPAEACLEVLRRIAARTRRPHLLQDDGAGGMRPNFQVVLFALRRDGAFGSASFFGPQTFAVCDAAGARKETSAVLFG